MKRIKCRFFAGQRYDRAGVVARVVLDGWSVTVIPSPQAVNLPKEGQKWEVELERKLFWVDPTRKMSVMLALPLRMIPDAVVPEQGEKRHIPIRPFSGNGEVVSATKAVLTPERPKPASARHRSPNATNVGATTQKGPHVEITPKGTSRKSLQKQRRRERLQNA